MRIASLLPSATEMVCSVGARDSLVGVSHECDYPADVVGLPVLTRPRTKFPSASGAIDRAVREMLTDALTVYEVEVDRLREARPEVIVTQDLCDVCAVSIDDVRKALKELAREDVHIVSLKPLRLADVWDDVRRVGEAVGAAAEGQAAAARLEERSAEIAARSAELDTRPRVLTIEWLDPIMVGGTWMPELVEMAGGVPLVTKPGDHAPTLTLEQLGELEPDVVLIKPCGFDIERTLSERKLLEDMLPWSRWGSARERAFVADGNAFFNRPGPRLVESLEILAACTHPKAFADLAARRAGDFIPLQDGA